ncbi:hypothetical protein [Bacteriovorax sp. Seq25_V]|uniref:hypothetical protein n=1 Tax=Bacteriovorax sp. Seq25_V TaxID=1201288 RepID=UPI00038A4AB1|nr:hypothetical protein [Bacteriovorax sp. Seq25_V]EQC48059.1 thiamin pyrophosphokinase, catalytic domain protein [Bacteriovorax sp. Seq25_V]
MTSKIIQFIGPMDSNTPIDYELDTIIIDGGLNRVYDTLSSFKKIKNIIGDNDSNITETSMTTKLPRDKDESDLEYALKIVNENQYSNVRLNGFLGGRKDHEFANILTIIGIVKSKGPHPFRMYVDSQILITNQTFEKLNHHGVFSVFSIDNNILTISGKVKYPLLKKCIRPLSSHGISNEAHGKFEITNTNHTTLVIFFNE